MANNGLKAKREQIALLVGLALAEWAIVEGALTYLFAALLDRTKKQGDPGLILWNRADWGQRMTHTAFNAIISFETRVAVVSAVVEEAKVNKRLRALWPGIAKRLLKKYASRHQIAHFMISNIQQDDGSWEPFLVPYANSIGSSSETRLGCNEINHKAEQFKEIMDALVWFREAVERSRGREKAPLRQEPPLVERVRRSLENPSQ